MEDVGREVAFTTDRIVIVLCAVAFVRAMASLPSVGSASHDHCHNDPNVRNLRDEDTTFLQFVDSENMFLVDLCQ